MAYRSRSKYTPGGGVLVFFEQVSRFVSVSVLGWILLSTFLILFVADGRITDSLEIRLLKGIFTDWRLFGTAIMLIALNGMIGGIIAIPSALVLFMSRQYLDFQAGRGSRRGNAFKLRFVRSLPSTVLVVSHVVALLANLVVAPQLTRHWFKQDSNISSLWVASHFVLTALTRTSFDHASEESKAEKADRSVKAPQDRHLYLVFAPADFIESEDFKAEQAKLKDSQRIPFIISRSNIIEQLDVLMGESQTPIHELFRTSLNAPSEYGQVHKNGHSKVLLALSPQLRFGRQPTGLATDSLAGLKDDLLVYEAQRRIVSSQFQLFGFLKIFDGVPLFGKKLEWLQLISDDVSRIRSSAKIINQVKKESHLISVIQISSLERRFSNIHTPFSPIGWPANISTHERRLITKNIVRELSQFLGDVGASENSLWAILPYADEKRTNPMSYAVVKASGQFSTQLNLNGQQSIGMLNDELGQVFSNFIADEEPINAAEVARLSKSDSVKSAVKLKCFETEVDSTGSDFQFQPVELRERSLGEFLNSLVQLPDQDLRYLSKNALNLIAREPGFGFLCRTEHQSIDETYLLKHRSNDKYSKQNLSALSLSILISKSQSQGETSARASGARFAPAASIKSSNVQSASDVRLKNDVFDEFLLYQLLPAGSVESQSNYSWRQIDEREANQFFSKFESEILMAIETFARARIR